MKILVFLGSPRRKGNSESAAVTVVDQLITRLGAEAEYIRLAKEDISPCIACGGCDKTGECIVKDGMIDFLGTDTHHMGHLRLWKEVATEKNRRLLWEVMGRNVEVFST